MSASSSSTGGGISFLSLLFIVFLILKLTGVINWSWWWVTAPLWGGFLLGVIAIGVIIGLKLWANNSKYKY